MAQSFASNPSPQELRNQSYRQIRAGAVRQAFGPGGVKFSSQDERGLFEDPRSLPSIVAKTRLQHSLAESTVPPGHLNGLQFAHVARQEGGAIGGNMGMYYPRSRALVQNQHGVDWTDTQQAARNDRAVIHELGHHVEYQSRGTMASGGVSEGLAENYADRHEPGRMVWHMGVGVRYRAGSAYDTHLPLRDSPVFNTNWDPAGQVNRQVYARTRARGTMPDQY